MVKLSTAVKYGIKKWDSLKMKDNVYFESYFYSEKHLIVFFPDKGKEF